MKVLFLVRDIPFPAKNGYKKRNFYLLKALVDRGDEVFLLGRNTEDVRREDILELKKYCRKIKLLRIKEPKLGTLRYVFRSLFSSLPFSVLRRVLPELKQELGTWIKDNDIDLVICDSVYQSLNVSYDSNVSHVSTILYEHNVESLIIKRYAEQERNPFKKLFAYLEYTKMRRLEARMWKRFDCSVACSSIDKEYMEGRVPNAKVFVINNGVDTEYFRSQSHKVTRSQGNSLVYTGQIGWFPNEDAVLYFTREVLPLIKKEIPDVTFWVVGAKPSLNITRLACKDDSIKVTGFVSDVRKFMGNGSVFVVPLRIGSGTRLKILEALSMNRAIVSTSIGCEGLDLEDNNHLLVRDDPQAFADAVVNLLRDNSMKTKLGESGRKLVEERYDWNVVFRDLDGILSSVDQKTIPDSPFPIPENMQNQKKND